MARMSKQAWRTQYLDAARQEIRDARRMLQSGTADASKIDACLHLASRFIETAQTADDTSKQNGSSQHAQ